MLINLRNALMSGKRLPYDAEVEWLGSTGTQFILTNLVLNSYDYSFEYRGKKCEWGWIHNNVVPGTWLAAQFTGGVAYQFYRTFNARYAKTNLSPSTRYDYKYGINGFWIAGSYMGGASVSIGSDPITTGLTLFANYDFYNNSHQLRGTPNLPCTFEYFRAYKQDELVLDYIPVRVGTVGYLYDRVSGKLFGNAGTGDFVLGPDVVPVEWLEFTGTQRLLTDIPPNVYAQDLKTSISYQLTSTAVRQLSGSNSAYFEFCSNSALVQGDASYPADLNWHTLDFIGWDTGSSRVLYDGQNIASGGFVRTANTSNRFTFGSLRADTQSFPLKARVYSLLMEYQDGTKFLDWVPVRVGTDATSWEGAMMDVLTRRIYRNAGSGAFTYGNDLKYPILAE